MTTSWVTCILMLLVISSSLGESEVCLKVPPTFDECFEQSMGAPMDPKSAIVACLQRLLWFYEPNNTLTAEDRDYFSAVSRYVGQPRPRTGYRIRKEYRRLSDDERARLHKAFQTLYDRGVITRFNRFHAMGAVSMHGGASFPGWHRALLAHFEDELRLVDNTISLPYWASSFDQDMDNPVDSIIWSSQLLGNANGDVVTGPFSDWRTARGRLWRNYGSASSGELFSWEAIMKIMSQSRMEDIVFKPWDTRTSDKSTVLENHHTAVHEWVGGSMGDISYAANDPVFFMHHAFVDYIFEKFRQRNVSGIDPTTDYPTNTSAGQGPYDEMAGFVGYRNIDGLADFWTQDWYGYEDPPQCPDCGSRYLYCNVTLNRCVSHSRRTDFNPGQFRENSSSAGFGISSEPFEPETTLMPKRKTNPFADEALEDGQTDVLANNDDFAIETKKHEHQEWHTSRGYGRKPSWRAASWNRRWKDHQWYNARKFGSTFRRWNV